MRGQFIVICGIDGSGKTTQEIALANSLQRGGRRVVVTKNPTDWYRTNPTVRRYLDHGELAGSIETLALLSATDRMMQNDDEIIPALEGGSDVICNRYFYSTYAYFKARGADMTFVEAVNARALRPDRGILLTIDPQASVDRIFKRDGERRKFEERDATYLGIVQDELVRRWPADFLVLDAEADRTKLSKSILEYVL